MQKYELKKLKKKKIFHNLDTMVLGINHTQFTISIYEFGTIVPKYEYSSKLLPMFWH